MGRYCDLPEEVLEVIMSWLPPDSLKRFKRVCKSWHVLINLLIENPGFVAKHLGNMKKKKLSSPFIHLRNVLTTDYTEMLQAHHFLTLAHDGIDDDYEDDFDNNDYIPCVTDNLRFLVCDLHNMFMKLVVHCNGIICLSAFDKNDFFLLLNPAIKEFKIVPNACPHDGHEARAVGFGCDSRGNDYKVVNVKSMDDGPYKAEVFTLSSNSWKEIELNEEILHFPIAEYQVVYCSGVCYWYFWVWTCTIVSFDFGDEVFRRIPLPENVPRVEKEWNLLAEWTKIAVWNESLVLFFYTELRPIVIDMWVRDASSVGVRGACSWTKHLTIGPLGNIKYPLAFWDPDELIMETEDGEIVFYNLQSQELNDHTVCLEPFNSNRLVTYTKSLVSVLKREER
ncbi:F-box domain containing protein [Parasponia andersonii]|uniref:F-box domain containing protein n=1 Tax=Parasponia andersonii TaxID=3476 RepID=A0A2P5AHG7_PARAD|nr:F-box domain containing protein [Parasponia andersonii]